MKKDFIKTKQSIQFYIDLLVFGMRIYVIVSKDITYVKRAIYHHAHIEGLAFKPDSTKYPVSVWLPQKPKTAKAYGSLSHEVLHCVDYIGDRIGINHNKETEEFFAYIQGYLVQQILEKLA